MKATAAALLVLMAGCASQPAAPVAPSFSDTPRPVAPRSAARGGVGGGVFNPDAGLDLISDSRAFRVGDVVTVALQETTQASKKAGTSFNKGSSVGVKAANLLGKTLPKTGIDLSADRNFAGDSTSTQQNALSGAITAA